MCGICGFNWEEGKLVKEMASLLTHRGPDASGYYTNPGISLGHRRLSIIDLSEKGKQPMSNEDETLWITYNGEIYDFKPLKAELEQKGHRFRSETDTEVLIHGYEEYGEKILQHCNGMFAFALWNEKEKSLFLARDRFGVKPLYYYWDGKRFIFSSEIKSILISPEVPRKVNPQAAYNYLNLRYIPGEETLFAGIKKLPPGHFLILKNNLLTLKQYWDLPLSSVKEDPQAAEKVYRLLADSVRKRLVADVPVGIYLSGGIDSAALVALAAEQKKEPVKTFSVGFNYDEKVDELSKARAIAKHLGTDHHEIIVEDSIKELLPKIIWHLDQPHGDPVTIPQFKLSQLASTKVKVVLSGEGADEVFAGYVQYKNFLRSRKISFLPSSLMKTAAQLTPVKLFDQFFDYPASLGEKGKEKILDFLEDLKNEPQAYENLVSILSKKDKRLLFTEKIKENHHLTYFQPQRKPLLNRLLYYDTKTWLPDYVMYINDRLTMANSIEGREPFLDYPLAEYVTSLPSHLKIKGKVNKYVLRQALRKVLPEKIVQTKKHAFFMPLDKWYKEELRGLAEQLFTPALVKERGDFNYEYLKKIWENYEKSKLLYGKQLFTLINFELWQRMFIDSEKIPKDNQIKLSSLL